MTEKNGGGDLIKLLSYPLECDDLRSRGKANIFVLSNYVSHANKNMQVTKMRRKGGPLAPPPLFFQQLTQIFHLLINL